MKKNTKPRKARAKKDNRETKAHADQSVDQDRRKLFRTVRNSAIALAFVGGGGALLVQNVMGAMREHDLSRVNNGTPTIVQIHDPQCTMCLALQREARAALNHFDDEELDYVVANIRTPEGRIFANRYGVQHVTLLLFDNEGELQQVLQGQRASATLRSAFRQLL